VRKKEALRGDGSVRGRMSN